MTEISKRIYYDDENESQLSSKSRGGEKLNKSSNEKKTIAIFGATGGTGIALIDEALNRGHKVVAGVRNPAALERYKDKIVIKKINLGDLATVEEATKGCDILVTALGNGGFWESVKPTTLYSDSVGVFLEAMKKNNIKRGLFVTSAGVDPDDNAPFFYRMFIKPMLMNLYMDMMKMETIIECNGKSINWTIVRPSWLRDGKHNTSFHATERVIKEGSSQINRVDVAKFMIHEIENNLWIHGYPALSYD